MLKEIIMEPMNAASATLTPATMENLYNICNILESEIDNKIMSYRELQEFFNSKLGISPSSIRGWLPVLEKSGFVTYREKVRKDNGYYEYRSKDISLNTMIQPLGKVYKIILDLILKLFDSSSTRYKFEYVYEMQDKLVSKDSEQLICLFQNLLFNLNTMALINRFKYMEEDDDTMMCIDYLKFCNKYASIDKKEFLYMIATKQAGLNTYIDDIKEDIELYRKKELDFNIKVRGSESEPVAEGYVRSFLRECNLIIPYGDSRGRFKINDERRNIVDYLIQGE